LSIWFNSPYVCKFIAWNFIESFEVQYNCYHGIQGRTELLPCQLVVCKWIDFSDLITISGNKIAKCFEFFTSQISDLITISCKKISKCFELLNFKFLI
jgi:hypothetical protein